MKDSVLYDMISQTEYDANMFAADLLTEDEHIYSLSQEDIDHFNICKHLYTTTDVMNFKLCSLIRREYIYVLPMGMDSRQNLIALKINLSNTTLSTKQSQRGKYC